MKVAVTLIYDVEGDTNRALDSLGRAYDWRQGRTESISCAEFRAVCISPKAQITPLSEIKDEKIPIRVS